MASPVRRSAVRGRAPARRPTITQIDRKVLRNRFAPLEPLNEEQLECVHDLSMQILEEQGIAVVGEVALALFRKAGAKINGNGNVCIDRALLLETIAAAPASFTVTPRNPSHAIP